MAILERSIVGILGGGQLGRMLALAAAAMGVRCHIYAPEQNAVAAEVASSHTQAAYTDEKALRTFAESVDVITYEFENVPVSAVEFLETLKPVYPRPAILALAQDRLFEKQAAEKAGLRVGAYVAIDSAADITKAPANLFPGILKTRRLGYDGKGQISLTAPDESAFAALGNVPSILEQRIPFSSELSVLVARNKSGQLALYPPIENQHENGILRSSSAPAAVSPAVAAAALAAVKTLAEKLDLIGLMALEFFVLADGTLLFNECAPRPHNSGHWTIEGSYTSQYAQTIRAVLNWPLGSTQLRGGRVKMQNLLGDEALEAADHRRCGGAAVHLYGKDDIKAGRKLGHVTWAWRKHRTEH